MGEKVGWAERGAGSRNGLPGRGLRGRLVFWFLILSLIPLFTSNTIGYLRSDEIIEDLVLRYLDGLAGVQALHVRDQVEQNRLYLQAVAAGNDFLAAAALRSMGEEAGPMGQVVDARTARGYLERKLAELSGYLSLYVYAPDGRILLAVATRDSGEDIPHVVSHPHEPLSVHRGSHLGGAPSLRLSVPLTDGEEEAVAYLGGMVSLASPSSFLELPQHIAGSVESFVTDEAGRPLFISHTHGHTHYDEALATPLVDMPVGSSARYRNGEGVEVVGTSVPIGDLGWRFITEVPVDDALGSLQALRRLSIVLEVLMGGLVIFAAWIVAGGIVAPIRRLVRATRKVGAGRLDTRVSADERDEIGELGAAFNQMAQELEQSSAKIQELHDREIARAAQLATVGELASGVAHEIKNPVMGLSSGLDLVMRRVGNDAELDPIVEEMEHQLGRIESAVRDMLTFARPTEPTPGKVDLNGVIRRTMRLVAPAAEQAGVDVVLHLDEDLPRVWIDEEMIGQVIVNLSMNAVQAMEGGGELQVETRCLADEVHLRFRDTGDGIAPDELGRIFRPFHTTKHQGTGLGLPITRSLVIRHGGHLRVDSEVGEGTTFDVFLPLDARKALDAPTVEGSEVP